MSAGVKPRCVAREHECPFRPFTERVWISDLFSVVQAFMVSQLMVLCTFGSWSM